MKRFKNILVVVDKQISHSDNSAISQAAELAKRNNARLTLMDIIKEPADAMNTYKGIISANELTGLMVKQREADMADIVSSLQADNVDVSTKVIVGLNFIEIIRQVLRENHDLIVKVATGQDKQFASNDFQLMRKNPCPVWLIKQEHADSCQHVLAAVDIAQEDTEEGRQLNDLIMYLATSLAHWKNSKLHLLSCWTLYGESTLRHNSFVKVSANELSAIMTAEETAFQQRLDVFSDKYNDATFAKHLIKGKPGECIPEFVEQHNIDTVVMGTVGRTGISGLLIGNTAETVLQSIDSSVITVKPSGFKCPVT